MNKPYPEEGTRWISAGNHGRRMKCPTCGAPGHFDLMESGSDKNEAEYFDAIWYGKSGQWECHECWLK